jgi:hypothetical protein
MPKSAVDISRFRIQIEKQLLVDHRTQKEVVSWLETQGVSITLRQLGLRCKEWKASRRGATTDEKAIEKVYWRFHTTTEDDATIVKKLTDEGISIFSRQVKELRLQRQWRRHASNDT